MSARRSGGAHTSRTMLVNDLRAVLTACPTSSSLAEYRCAVVDDNVAGKSSRSGRERTFRYLRELYGLDLAHPEFRAFLRLWSRDTDGRPLLALLMACSRDAALFATSPPVLNAPEGSVVTSHDLAAAVEDAYPGSYSEAVRDKIGRNALSSWRQAGFLSSSGRLPATRQWPTVTPGALAMALVIGSDTEVSGERLFATPAATLLDVPLARLHDLAHDAARKGLLEYRSRGQVTEIDLGALTAGPDDPRLPIGGDSP